MAGKGLGEQIGKLKARIKELEDRQAAIEYIVVGPERFIIKGLRELLGLKRERRS